MSADRLFGIHIEAVKLRGERARILAQNMANADTPGFRARDVAFEDILSKQAFRAAPLQTTHTGHIPSAGDTVPGGALQYRVPQQPSLDGNSVDLQTERAEFIRNALMYQTSLQFLNGRIKGLMTAIRGE